MEQKQYLSMDGMRHFNETVQDLSNAEFMYRMKHDKPLLGNDGKLHYTTVSRIRADRTFMNGHRRLGRVEAILMAELMEREDGSVLE